MQHDPAVQSVVGFTGAGSGGGGGQTNTGQVFVALKPLAQRAGIDAGDGPAAPQAGGGAGRAGCSWCRSRTSASAGGRAMPPISTPCRATAHRVLYEWAPKLLAALEHNPVLRDVNSDQQQKGLETDLVIDRATASRLGVSASQIDNTLYDAFGQRQVSTIYSALNQYHVVMEVAPRYWQTPETLKDIYVSTVGRQCQRHRDDKRRGRHCRRDRSHEPPAQRARSGCRQHRQQFGAQRGDQCAGQHRQGQRIVRRRGQHQQGDDGAAGRVHPLRARQHAAGGQSPGAVRRHARFPSIWRRASR